MGSETETLSSDATYTATDITEPETSALPVGGAAAAEPETEALFPNTAAAEPETSTTGYDETTDCIPVKEQCPNRETLDREEETEVL